MKKLNKISILLVLAVVLLNLNLVSSAIYDDVTSWDYASQSNSGYGIATDNLYIYLTSYSDSAIFLYYMNGTYTGTSYDISSVLTNPYGITHYNADLYVLQQSTDMVFAFNRDDGTDAGINFSISDCVTDGIGITNDGTYFYITDVTGLKICKYDITGTLVTSAIVDTNNTQPKGIAYYDNQLYVYDASQKKIHVYNSTDLTIISESVALNSTGGGIGLETNGTYFWLSDYGSTDVMVLEGALSPASVFSEGDYLGITIDVGAVGNANPYGMATNNTFLWVTDAVDDLVYIYTMNGTYTGNTIDLSAEMGAGITAYGIATDNNYLWIQYAPADTIYIYYMNGTYTGDSWVTTNCENDGLGITYNGSSFFVVDTSNKVCEYDYNGNYITEWDLSSNITAGWGIAYYGGYLWIPNNNAGDVYKFTTEGVSVSSWAKIGSQSVAIATNGSVIFVADDNTNLIYLYQGILSDNESPQIAWNDPTNNVLTYATTYNLDVTITNLMIDTVNVTVYNSTGSIIYSNLTNGINSASFTVLDVIPLNEGENTIEIYAIDQALNTITDSKTIESDATNPAISITSPTAIDYTTMPTEITYTYTEVNCGSAFYSTDGGVTNSTNISCGDNFTGLTATTGSNTWTVYIRDLVGNIGSSSVTFTYTPSELPSYTQNSIYQILDSVGAGIYFMLFGTARGLGTFLIIFVIIGVISIIGYAIAKAIPTVIKNNTNQK
jgi:sugar lactone lactonase YvrE